MEELMFESAIDNNLTGQTKLARQEEEAVKADTQLERMSTPGGPAPTAAAPGATVPR
jgi:hypothetical protein